MRVCLLTSTLLLGTIYLRAMSLQAWLHSDWYSTPPDAKACSMHLIHFTHLTLSGIALRPHSSKLIETPSTVKGMPHSNFLAAIADGPSMHLTSLGIRMQHLIRHGMLVAQTWQRSAWRAPLSTLTRLSRNHLQTCKRTRIT